jgi:hypothetical protein
MAQGTLLSSLLFLAETLLGLVFRLGLLLDGGLETALRQRNRR